MSTDPITPEERLRWRALDAEATPAPWEPGREIFWSGDCDRPRCRVYRGRDSEEIADAIAFGPPLTAERQRNGVSGYIEIIDGHPQADAVLIAAYRTAVPRLLSALGTAETDIEDLMGERDLVIGQREEARQQRDRAYECHSGAASALWRMRAEYVAIIARLERRQARLRRALRRANERDRGRRQKSERDMTGGTAG